MPAFPDSATQLACIDMSLLLFYTSGTRTYIQRGINTQTCNWAQVYLHNIFVKCYKDVTLYIFTITMPAYLANSGVKQEICDDNFDLLWKEVSEEDEVSTSAA